MTQVDTSSIKGAYAASFGGDLSAAAQRHVAGLLNGVDAARDAVQSLGNLNIGTGARTVVGPQTEALAVRGTTQGPVGRA